MFFVTLGAGFTNNLLLYPRVTEDMGKNITYLLCMNEEAASLYMESINRLVESDCFDFMVYKLVDGNRKYQAGIDTWSEEVEISEGFYSILHINLCPKLKPSPNPKQ